VSGIVVKHLPFVSSRRYLSEASYVDVVTGIYLRCSGAYHGSRRSQVRDRLVVLVGWCLSEEECVAARITAKGSRPAYTLYRRHATLI
jgi:hypothetical protein